MGPRLRLVVALSTGAASATAVAACNSISGVDDFVVGGGVEAQGFDATAGSDGGSGGDVVTPVDAFGDADGSKLHDGHPHDSRPDDGGTDGETDATEDGGQDGAPGAPEGGDSAHEMDSPADGTTMLDALADGPADVTTEEAVDAPGDAAKDATSSGPCDGGTAMVVHSNGFGQTFADCAPLSTYDVTQAFEACGASTGDAGACSVNPGGLTCGGGNLVCTTTSSTCTCWRFDGHPGSATTVSGGCNCLPNAAPVVWN